MNLTTKPLSPEAKRQRLTPAKSSDPLVVARTVRRATSRVTANATLEPTPDSHRLGRMIRKFLNRMEWNTDE